MRNQRPSLNMIRPLTLALAVVFATVGCETVNTAERAEPGYERQVIHDKRVTTDTSLQAAARLMQLSETTLDTGFLKVQAEIYNNTSTRRRVSYQFEWFDGEGMRIDTSMSNWQAIALAGKESRYIDAVAPTREATDFRLKLIEPEN